MSQEKGPAPGLFSHETVPVDTYAADTGEAHHRPVFSAEETQTISEPPAPSV